MGNRCPCTDLISNFIVYFPPVPERYFNNGGKSCSPSGSTCQLMRHELGIKAAACQQFVMGAALDHLTLIKRDDLVGAAHGG